MVRTMFVAEAKERVMVSPIVTEGSSTPGSSIATEISCGAQASAPVILVIWLAGHSMQSAAPGAIENLPALHCWQELAAVRPVVPP